VTEAAARMTRDFVRDRGASLLIWGLPALVIIVTGPLGLRSPAHGCPRARGVHIGAEFVHARARLPTV